MSELSYEIEVNETLVVEATTIAGPQVWVIRKNDGALVLQLSEVRGVVDALSKAAARLAAEVSGGDN